MKKAYSILLILLAGLTVNAQQVGQNNQGGQATPTFQVSSQLVIETVAVTGKGGMAVEGLKAEDFNITEDGIPQVISVFVHQRFEDVAVSLPSPLTTQVIPLEKYPQAQIRSEIAGKVRYQDR